MIEDKWIARIVGVLFIIGTVAGVLSVFTAGPVLDDSDYLTEIAANEDQFVSGTLLVLTMGLALALVPVVIFPVLKKQDEILALGYVVFRGALETFAYMALVIVWLFLLTLSQEYVKAGAPVDAAYYQTLGTSLQDAGDWISEVTQIVFPLGALMFYTMLYRSKLIPRWISGWGLIALIPYLAATFLAMYDVIEPMGGTEVAMRMPLAVQEMVMAIWLIAKGFNPSALASGSSNTDTNEMN
jgi:hypothetical protein